MRSVLAQFLMRPDIVRQFTLKQWDMLIRQSRHASLLARVARLVDECQPAVDVPQQVEEHLLSVRRLAHKQIQSVRFEADQIEMVLAPLEMPVILLKGAAYVVMDLPPAFGRLFSDVDIMVPKERLRDVERHMVRRGWVTTHHDKYDQHYYRTWMHELPPMKHNERHTVIDIHHTILPETACLKPDPKKLMEAAVKVPGSDWLYVLAPADMVLHSATHLFHDGELENGLRDLSDLDALLRYFSREEGFWERLIERAVVLDLERPLYYALRFCHRILATPVPDIALKASEISRPKGGLHRLMDALFERALMPDHPSCDDALTGVARWMLYVRSHHLRMPIYLLIPHLIRKAFKRHTESTPLGDQVPDNRP